MSLPGARIIQELLPPTQVRCPLCFALDRSMSIALNGIAVCNACFALFDQLYRMHSVLLAGAKDITIKRVEKCAAEAYTDQKVEYLKRLEANVRTYVARERKNLSVDADELGAAVRKAIKAQR